MLNGFHIMTVAEYKAYLDGLKEKVEEWRDAGFGYVSITYKLAKEVTKNAGTYGELMFTETQLKEIFGLAE